MATIQVVDAADMFKLLTQTTQPDVPDNPAEQLSDYVAAPASGSDDVALTDVQRESMAPLVVTVITMNYPYVDHSGTYVYADPSSMWEKAQWS